MTKQYWFRAKTYGYGWTPNTWQGWLVLAAAVVGFIDGVYKISAGSRVMGSLEIGLFLIMLIAVCVAKGEPAKWRWGKTK